MTLWEMRQRKNEKMKSGIQRIIVEDGRLVLQRQQDDQSASYDVTESIMQGTQGPLTQMNQMGDQEEIYDGDSQDQDSEDDEDDRMAITKHAIQQNP